MFQAVPLLIRKEENKVSSHCGPAFTVSGRVRNGARLWKRKRRCCWAVQFFALREWCHGHEPFDFTTSTVETGLPLQRQLFSTSLPVFLAAFAGHARWRLTSVGVQTFLRYRFDFACPRWITSWPAGRVSSFLLVTVQSPFLRFWLLRAVPLAFFVCVCNFLCYFPAELLLF